MGTPEKKQMIEDCVDASAAAEGSPVFNYISNLSPIKPVKSIHVSHTFQELNCASPPYAFAFPRITCTGQSSNLRRDRLSASSDAKFSLNAEERKTPKRADILEHPSSSTEAAVKLKSDGVLSAASQENLNRSLVLCSSDGRPIYDNCSTVEATNPSIRDSNLVVEAYQILHYIDNVSKGIMTPTNNAKTASGSEMANIMPFTEIEPPGTSTSFVQLVNISNAYESESEQSASEIQPANAKDSVGFLNQEIGGGPGCDWGDIVVNDIDEFFLLSPSVEADVHYGQAHLSSSLNCSYGASFAPKHSQTMTTGWNKIKICGSLQPSHNVNRKDSINGSTEPDEPHAMDLTPQMSSAALQSVVSNGDTIEKTDDRSIYPDGHWIPLGCKVEQQQVRGVKRRCLVFEAVGHTKNTEGNADLIDLKPSHSDGVLFPDDKQLVPSDVTYNSRRVASGIGLHLNSLANPSMVGRVIKQEGEAMISGSQVVNSASLATLNPASIAQEPTESSMDLKLTDGELDISEEKISPVAVGPAFEFGEEIIQQSPKKKRRKASQSGEKEGCKKCHCKRSKCLKLYCECFAAGVYCIQQCSCQGCLNKPEHEDTVLETRERIESRNPLAFVPKVVKPAEPVLESKEEENKLLVSARHKTGCNCKKSKCLKKYCECFQGGVGCSTGCRCEGCMNTFGRKEAPKLLTGSREVEEEVSEVAEPDENLKSQEIEKDDDKQSSQGSSLTTAFEICRSAILPPPFLSSGKATQPSRISGCNTVNTGFLLSRLKNEKHFMRTLLEDDTPEFLRVCHSPNDKVTVASPNRKRISPPRIESGACPGFIRNSRKLVLHPISSLQTLRVAHCSDDLSTKSS